jgi:hypothetical protein
MKTNINIKRDNLKKLMKIKGLTLAPAIDVKKSAENAIKISQRLQDDNPKKNSYDKDV